MGTKPPLPDRHFDEFRPQLGERISVVGDWVLDKSETEIHEIRLGSTVRQDKDHADLWYLFTSGFFARDTAQKDVLTVSVPVPLPKDLNLSSAKTDLNCSIAVTDVGCDNPGSAGVTVVKEVNRDASGRIVSGKCVIRADRDTSTDQALNERFCGIPFQDQRVGDRLKPRFQCPCFGLNQVAEVAQDQDLICTNSDIDNNLGRCNFDGFTDAHFQQPHHTSDATIIAFSRVIQAEWVDPLSLWSCNCSCDDPSFPGATVGAMVAGCADPAFKPDEDQDIQAACSQACQGTICGDEANCRIGACHSNGSLSGSLVADDACESANTGVLVSSTGDFHVQFDPAKSVVQIGTVNGAGKFNADANTPAIGDMWLNITGRGIEVTEFAVAARDLEINKNVGFFKLGSASIRDSYSVIATRFQAAATGMDGGSMQVGGFTVPMPNFEVQPAQAKFTVHSTVNGSSGYANFVNDGPLEISIDVIKNYLFLYGVGKDGTSDNAVSLHLEGRIVNHPPVANSGGDRAVECTSYTTTPVLLDGSASTDPDGNAIAHYQWFEGDAGLGNTAAVTTQAIFGMHAYTFHVYDQDLAADAQTAHINVRDTTPPKLYAVASPACYWPPNHAFVRLDLTTDLHGSAVDICDPNPTVEVVSVSSDQADNAPGSATPHLTSCLAPIPSVCDRSGPVPLARGTTPFAFGRGTSRATVHSPISPSRCLTTCRRGFLAAVRPVSMFPTTRVRSESAAACTPDPRCVGPT